MNGLRVAAALVGFLAVALGAFGAHGLEGRLSPEAVGWWETATLYALTHAAAAAGLSAAADGARTAGRLFVAGAAVFSGSLYALALTSLGEAPLRALGAITPIGGVLLLAGWGRLIFDGFRGPRANG